MMLGSAKKYSFAAAIAAVALFATSCGVSQEEMTELFPPEKVTMADLDSVPQIDNPRAGYVLLETALPEETDARSKVQCQFSVGDYVQEIGSLDNQIVVQVSTHPSTKPEPDRQYCGSGRRTLVTGATMQSLANSLQDVVGPARAKFDHVQRALSRPNPSPRKVTVTGGTILQRGTQEFLYVEPQPLFAPTAKTIREYTKSGRDAGCYFAPGAQLQEIGQTAYGTLVEYQPASEPRTKASCANGTTALVDPYAFEQLPQAS